MKKLILILATTLITSLSVAQCTADFTYSVNPLNPLQLTFTETSTFPSGSFNFEYGWYVSGVLTSTINPAVITFSANGTYQIKFFNKACIGGGIFCSDDTIKFITVDGLSTGIKDNNITISKTFLPYPNPTSGIFNIKLTESDINQKYLIINQLGQTILYGEFKNINEKIDLSVLASGIYFLSTEKRTVKIVKQ